MPNYSFFTRDTRYRVPSLLLSNQPDAVNARKVARQLLYNSPQHLSVDVYLDDSMIAHVGRKPGSGASQ